jgi:hypothetical protein
MYPIASQTVGSGGASSVTFSSILQTFTHLQLRCFTHFTGTNVTATLGCVVNGDTGTNYTTHQIYADGASANSYGSGTPGAGSVLSIGQVPDGTSYFGVAIIDILDYTNTNKYKTFRSITGNDRNGAGDVRFMSGMLITNTNAITSLLLQPGAGASAGSQLAQYSTFQLYGISTSSITGA